MSQLAARVRAPAASGNAKALEPPDRENVSSSPSPDKSIASAPGRAPPMSPSESTSEPSPPACAAPGGAPGAKGGTGANMAAGGARGAGGAGGGGGAGGAAAEGMVRARR